MVDMAVNSVINLSIHEQPCGSGQRKRNAHFGSTMAGCESNLGCDTS